jgi:serine/threonine-protein kinase RsbW
MVIPSDFESARRVESFLLGAIAEHHYSEGSRFAVRLAVEEAVTNAIKHGNRLDPRKTISIGMDVDSRQVEITVADQGSGFDPASVPDPTTQENLEKPSGRGIMLMRAYMDQVQYNPVGTQVRMLKRKA